jgi:hypothetical protein
MEQDRAYNEKLHAYRGVGEGIFGALTVEFREQSEGEKGGKQE